MTKQPPTSTELAILGVLWELGPSTVRSVHEQISTGDKIGYTSVLKMMQVMHKKGLLLRDESQRSHVYRPTQPAESTQQGLLQELVDKAFAGSAAQLAVRALSARGVSREELDQVRRFLDQMEQEHGD